MAAFSSGEKIVGPLKMMLQIASSMALAFLMMLVVMRKEKMALSFSKRPLEMLTKIILVMLSIRTLSWSWIFSYFSVSAIALLNNCLM